MLVFFDDTLIYNKAWEEHVQHVDMALQLLKEQQLYAKPSKYFFRVKKEFFSEGLKFDVRRFMEEYLVFQQNKVEIVKTTRILQPLDIPC